MDSAGNVYVGSGTSVPEITPGGTKSTFFTSSSLLSSPVAVAGGASGAVYASTNMSGPQQLAFDSQGNLFVANRNSGNVTKITPSGVSSVFASPSRLLIGLAIDSSDNVYVANKTGGQIYEDTPSGAGSTFATGLNGPKGLAFDSSGNLYVVQNGTPNVVAITPGGTKTTFATTGLNNPDGIAVVSSNPASLSVSATHSSPIFQGGPGSITLTVAHSGGATAGAATVTDTIDSAFTINSYPAGCTDTGQVVTCTIASGATAASTSFTIYVTASTSASTAGISNAATLTDTSDTIATGSASDTITVGAQLALVDTSLAQVVLSGATDNGACAAGNLTLTATDTIQNNSEYERSDHQQSLCRNSGFEPGQHADLAVRQRHQRGAGRECDVYFPHSTGELRDFPAAFRRLRQLGRK